MKQLMYAMRRANGDWFAMHVGGQNRVPVFRTLDRAWRARAKNPELMLFRPAPVDEMALEDLVTADDGQPAAFWLVDEEDPAAILTHGRPLGFEQLATLGGVMALPSVVRLTRAPRQSKGFGWAARVA
jgi:hypothetical protein